MLSLFTSLFTSEPPKSDAFPPESIVQLAIQRAVDATDKRIGLLPGFEKKLRPAVLLAIDHVVSLLDELPPPVELNKAGYSTDERISAFFSSPKRINQVLASNRAFLDFRDGRDGRIADRAFALLMLVHDKRKVLGMELQGESIRREVAQTVVSFSQHTLLDPAADAEANLKLLRRRAFDHLLEQALDAITSARESRGTLERELGLLRRKLNTFKSGAWGFEPCNSPEALCPEVMETRIEELEKEIEVLGGSSETLEHHLDVLIGVLEKASDYLRLNEITLTIDSMGVIKERGEPHVKELKLQEISSKKGPDSLLMPVEIPREDWPQPTDFLDQAQRYLG